MSENAVDDARCMQLALRLARRGLGRTWPNPAVGCVVVRGGRIVGRGWTRPGGRPHAETEALRRAGKEALGATLYVSLEPCAHYGQTPPCTMALIHAGVRRVVVAAPDPDPRVDGQGIAQLRQAGIRVDVGLGRDEAVALNQGFFLRVREGRPLVTLKLATSLDGRIATASGASRWITGEASRRRVHLDRARHDAILIGSGTALADDPLLDCRLEGMEGCSPVRIVLDARLRLAPGSRLAASAGRVPLWVVTVEGADPARARALAAAGAAILVAPAAQGGGVEPCGALAALARQGITRVLVEGGAAVAASFLAADLVDRLLWYQAPIVIGGDGRAAIGPLGTLQPEAAARFSRLSAQELRGDIRLAHARPCLPR
jgi:diaminohydroxyphosphoribosylaminopyrimidine deaminase / 5-amino-6-(5-phosphoribosylamino)uracil reductase